MPTPRPKNLRADSGEPIDVEWNAKLPRFRDGYGRSGTHTPETSKTRAIIRVASGHTHDGERATFLHEWLHDLISRSDVRGVLSLKDEEYILSELDGRLLRAMQMNPDAIEWLMEKRPE